MNKETIITAIVALLVAIFDLLKVFNICIPVDSDFLYSLVTVVVGVVVYWRNQDWTREAHEATGYMRLMKAQKKGKIDGENFIEDGEGVDGE